MLNRPRVAAALILGIIGCLFIWIAAPYNNFFLNNSYIADTYIPVAAVVFTLVLILAVNPVLYLLNRKWMLNRRQLALIFAMLLAGAVLASQGLLRTLPWSIARSNQEINLSPELSTAIQQSAIPQSLFPDPIGYHVDTPVSDQFLDELFPGESIPWEKWLALVPVWGPFLLASWLLMVGVGLVLFPEWKEKERLPFPLLGVYRSLLPEDGSGRVLPSIFRDRVFWVGAGSVVLLYALDGLNHHTHGRVPAIPLGWNLSPLFTELPWRALSSQIKNVNQIYFVLVGMAFFMPNRVGFSIWFTTVAYCFYEMLARSYMPSYYGGIIHDHRNGAMIAVACLTLWLSRRHWLRVASTMIHRVSSDSDRLLKVSGWMTLIGAVGMFIWLRWVGVPDIWAALFIFIGFMVSLLVARIVAETGMPFIRITGLEPLYLLAMVPASWLNGAAVFAAGFIEILFPLGSRVSAAVMVSHAAGVDENAGPRHQLRIGYLMIALFVVGLLVCGAVHLYMGYTQPVTLDGTEQPINLWGSQRFQSSQQSLLKWTVDAWPMPAHRLGNLTFGIALAAGLQIACMTLPRWPLHPIGMLIVGSFYGQTAWASILFGWSIKMLLIYLGGAAAYHRARPLFLGLILGEIFSAVIWTVVPVGLLGLGFPPADVGHIDVQPK